MYIFCLEPEILKHKRKPEEFSHMRGRNFLICGLTGWCMEILFTSASSLARHDGRLIGQTSLWMFPIYGMAACIGPVYAKIKKLPGTSAAAASIQWVFFHSST